MDSLLRQDAPRIPAGPVSQIVSLCEEFERGWSSGTTAEFDPYLERVSDEMRVSLLRNLLQIELRRRRDAGDAPRQDEYLSRYDRYADVIRDEFQVHASTRLVSLVPDTETADTNGRSELPLPAVSRLGDYLLEAELGRGAMGIVFAARHLRHGARVALKTLPTVDGARLHRFKREFRALSNVNHPSLVGLHALQADGGQWFFTMDLVDGTDFLRYVRPDGKLDRARLRDALRQLILGVQALHAHGIVHRDIKPTNVMVTREGRVRLLDFGLVVEFGAAGDDGEPAEIAGTPAYMAPEQFLGQTGPASDWYAVGVMLYQALSGKLPFTGSVDRIFQAKQSGDPPPAPADMPDELATLCRRLLARDKTHRPAGPEILSVFAPDQAGDMPPTLAGERLTGREEHLRGLQQALESFEQSGAAATMFISGRSGEGKTILAEQFLEGLRGDGRWTILAGRCYDRESMPFKALDTLIDALCLKLRRMPEDDVADIVPTDAAVLAELFPVLNQVPAVARLPQARMQGVEPQRVRRLAAGALREIFRRLAARTNLLCFIDDLQWGDDDSAELLLDVLRPPAAPGVLLLGTFRSDEAADSPFLQAWEAGCRERETGLPRRDCVLAPLSEEQSIALVVDIVGDDSPAVRERARLMAEETGGNPFLLSELAGCYDPTAAAAPTRMDEVVERKLTLLPEDARALLDVICVSGQALSLDEAAHTAGHTVVPMATIARMRTERLLRLVGIDDEPAVDTYHDRVRETILRDMDTPARKRLHVRLGEEIEASLARAAVEQDGAAGNPRVYDLAYHFFEGGDGRAFGYQLQAGEQSLKARALQDAIHYLERAKDLLPKDSSAATCYRLFSLLGEACGLMQRAQDGLRYWECALSHASKTEERTDALEGAGAMHHRMGDFDAAHRVFDSALGELQSPQPKSAFALLVHTNWLLTFCLFPSLARPLKSESQRRRARAINQLSLEKSNIYLVAGKVLEYTYCTCNAIYHGLRSGEPRARATGFAKLAFNNAAMSLRFLGRLQANRALKVTAEIEDPDTVEMVNGMLGCANFCLGDLESSERLLNSAIARLNATGDNWYLVAWHHHLRHIHSARGHSQKAYQEAEIEDEIGRALSDQETICWGQYGMADAMARMGCLTEAHDHIQSSLEAIRGRNSHLTESIALNYHGFVLLQSSCYSQAMDVLERVRELTGQMRFYSEYTAQAYPRLVEALVGPDWRQLRQDEHIRRAKRVSWVSRFFGWRFPTVRAHALRIHGRLLCALGKPQRGRRSFQESIDAARRIGAEYDLARALLDLAAVDEERREELRAEAVATLKRLNAVIPYAERWQLGNEPDESCVAPRYSTENQNRFDDTNGPLAPAATECNN